MRHGYYPAVPFTAALGARIPRTAPAPAAGHALTFAFPGGGEYRWMTGQCTFTASAEAANRILQCSITDGTNTLWTQASSSTVTASHTITVSIVNEQTLLAPAVAGEAIVFGVPTLFYQAGWTIVLTAQAIAATDTFSALSCYVEQIVNDPNQAELGDVQPSIQVMLEEPLSHVAR